MHEYNFFVPPHDIEDDFVFIKGDEYRHCCRVLRKSQGAIVSVFDGKGHKKEVKLLQEEDSKVRAKVIKNLSQERKVKPSISIGVGIVRNKAMKLIIDRITSLGVDKFTPLEMQNCIKYKFRRDKFMKKSIQAAKQSGTAYLPSIDNNHEIQEWLENQKRKELKLIASQEGSQTLSHIYEEHPDVEDVAILVGPEGGFHDREIEMARSLGFIPINIFPFRLRTEVAVTNLISGLYHFYN
ncbi:MAG TPA: RsmE family RNA methyltransferase [bacterium]|nr:RsmE family RNA methyltransferase [bacterium]